MRKEKLLQNLFLLFRNTTVKFYIKQFDMVVNSIGDRFQQKDYIGTLQTMEMPLLKVFCEEDFGHELQQMSSFLSSGLDKFKLEAQLKTLAHIVDENKLE